MEPCIICTESTKDGLKLNDLCPCKYYIHTSCWIKYINSTTYVKCLICRKEVSLCKPINIISYNLQPNQEISYEEFRNIIENQTIQVIIPPNRIIETRSSQYLNTINLKNKIIACILIIIIISSILLLIILIK